MSEVNQTVLLGHLTIIDPERAKPWGKAEEILYLRICAIVVDMSYNMIYLWRAVAFINTAGNLLPGFLRSEHH